MKLLKILKRRRYFALLPEPRAARHKPQGSAVTLWLTLIISGCLSPVVFSSVDNGSLFEAYQSVAARAYQDALAKQAYSANTTASAEDFWQELDNRAESDLIGSVLANFNFIVDNIYEPQVRDLVTRLLDEGGYFVARQIHTAAKNSGDRYLVTKLNFDLARHHLRLSDHKGCAYFLDQTFISNALTENERDYAEIMRGILLQAESNHRESIKHYRSIEPDSPHYGTAQLNLATAYIRQDWWTDAHAAIDNAIEVTDDADYRDRLLTVLGYSQFQKELYRDARSTFRRVRTNSSYSRRALLGLGLAALHQGDYTGGLNAFRLLKQSDVTDKYKAEAYLLTAVALEKLDQPGAASAAFSEAMAFYEGMARDLENARAKPAAAVQSGTKAAETLILTKLNTTTVEADIKAIEQLYKLPISTSTRTQIDQVLQQYRERRQHLIFEGLSETLGMIEHYLSQAQFGVARIHDSAN